MSHSVAQPPPWQKLHQLEQAEIPFNPFSPDSSQKQQQEASNTVHVFQKQIQNINVAYEWSTSCGPILSKIRNDFPMRKYGRPSFPYYKNP